MNGIYKRAGGEIALTYYIYENQKLYEWLSIFFENKILEKPQSNFVFT